jgi:hypothetical protein
LAGKAALTITLASAASPEFSYHVTFEQHRSNIALSHNTVGSETVHVILYLIFFHSMAMAICALNLSNVHFPQLLCRQLAAASCKKARLFIYPFFCGMKQQKDDASNLEMLQALLRS